MSDERNRIKGGLGASDLYSGDSNIANVEGLFAPHHLYPSLTFEHRELRACVSALREHRGAHELTYP
jgi:hypothetical protein